MGWLVGWLVHTVEAALHCNASIVILVDKAGEIISSISCISIVPFESSAAKAFIIYDFLNSKYCSIFA